MTRLCVVTIKDTWQDDAGQWVTDGGFPAQMSAISSLFEHTTMVLVRVRPRAGGMPLPPGTRVVPLPRPPGQDFVRKVMVLMMLPYYLVVIAREVWRSDVVHTPLPGDIGILGMLVAQLMRRPLIARYCGSWVTSSTTTIMNRIVRQWMRATAGGRNVMLATGAGRLEPAPGMHWVFVSAVSNAEFSAAPIAIARPPGRPIRMVFVGRLSAEKGVDVLLDALDALRARGVVHLPHLTVMGDGAERERLTEKARALALPVEFTGQLDRPTLSEHLGRADLCVQPSLSEGFSKAWLDAMAFGVPVVASRVGAAAGVIGADGERGWLVQPGSIESLAATLRGIIEGDIDWPAIRTRCRRFAESRTLEAWGAAIADICRSQWGFSLRNGNAS